MNIKTLRATEYWQKAGGTYVRIQAMSRKFDIPLDVEFDEIDEDPKTKYVVLLDDYFPVATCRMFSEDEENVHIGRVIVLEEYRGNGLGRRVVEEAEAWAVDLGYDKIVLNARDVAVHFYEKMNYTADYSRKIDDTFPCIYMEKKLEEKNEEANTW